MSIFQKKPIRVGDLVIGKRRLSFGTDGSDGSIRHFDEPSLILEIKEDRALVFFEQEGPAWYNLTKLERCYVKDEFSETNNQQPDRRVVAEDRLDSDRTPGNKSDT